jgi:rfaE bifunctional protein nucleotidyltransferase chain/domain
MSGQILSTKALRRERERLQRAGKKLVFTNGCFDILHVGHVRYLNAARKLGDALVVAINSDRSVRELKGQSRPVVGEAERAEMLAGLRSVDYVTIFDDISPRTLIASLLPDVLVKGGDYGLDEIHGREEAGLRESDRLPQPIFTPATKAEEGHDENISRERAAEIIGSDTADALQLKSLALYNNAAEHARSCGIIIADTKFEFGRSADGSIMLIDEVLTPDSSRFWPAAHYSPGGPQPSFDKQFVRDYLESISWNKLPPAPSLPADVAEATTSRYLEAFRLLTGRSLDG